MIDKKTGLTHKELSLADEYLSNGFNELKAYENSTYSQTCTTETKRVNTNKILHKPHVVAYIEGKLAEIASKTDVTVENIVAELSAIAFGAITSSFGIHTKITNKLKALELLGRYKAMFTDNINQTDTQQQRELDEIQTKECEAIARIRLQDFKVG